MHPNVRSSIIYFQALPHTIEQTHTYNVNIHGNIFHNNQITGKQLNSHQLVKKRNKLWLIPYDGILLSNKKGQHGWVPKIYICAKQKQSNLKNYTLYDSIYIKFQKRQNDSDREQISGCLELGARGKDQPKTDTGKLGEIKLFCLDCADGYTPVHS